MIQGKINQNVQMKNQLKKELKKININFNSQKLIKAPLKALKKIDINKFKKLNQKRRIRHKSSHRLRPLHSNEHNTQKIHN